MIDVWINTRGKSYCSFMGISSPSLIMDDIEEEKKIYQSVIVPTKNQLYNNLKDCKNKIKWQ